MFKPAFIDLSHHNSIPESLEAAAAAGIAGVIHKATEGSSYVDDKMDNRRYLAQEAGMMWGVYHFVRPGNMIEQVRHFLNTVTPYSDSQTLFCLDWEDSAVSLDDAVQFLEELEKQTGHSPVLYSGHVLKEALGGSPDPRISQYRLWLCQYGPEADLPPGFDNYWAWQYSDKGEVPGVTPPTDVNRFDGSVEELISSWAGIEEPQPPVEDKARVDITVVGDVTITVNGQVIC